MNTLKTTAQEIRNEYRYSRAQGTPIDVTNAVKNKLKPFLPFPKSTPLVDISVWLQPDPSDNILLVVTRETNSVIDCTHLCTFTPKKTYVHPEGTKEFVRFSKDSGVIRTNLGTFNLAVLPQLVYDHLLITTKNVQPEFSAALQSSYPTLTRTLKSRPGIVLYPGVLQSLGPKVIDEDSVLRDSLQKASHRRHPNNLPIFLTTFLNNPKELLALTVDHQATNLFSVKGTKSNLIAQITPRGDLEFKGKVKSIPLDLLTHPFG